MTVHIRKINESFIHVSSDDRGIEQEISEYFTFAIEGAKFMPAFKSGQWDGKARLYSMTKKTLPYGLYNTLVKYLKEAEVEIIDSFGGERNVLSYEEIEEYVLNLDLAARGEPIDPRDYQIEAIHNSLCDKHAIELSPTSSGKSLIIYSIIRWLIDKGTESILLLVPTVNLVEQLYSDFEDYSTINGWNVEEHVQKIYSGMSKEDTRIVKLSTWQSMIKMPKAVFESFDAVMVDEAHLANGKSITSILDSAINAEYKIGLTGTIVNKNINRTTLTGIFGPIHQVITTRQLMDAGKVTNLKINAVLLNHPKEECKLLKGMKYQDEIAYIVENTRRNTFISKTALSCTGNVLILFQFIRHGKAIHDIITKLTDRPVFYISGEVNAMERERIRKELDAHSNAILIASSQTTSTGVNIPALDVVIFASPTKSVYKVLQSIGRVLRLKDGKMVARLIDIGDNFSSGKKKNTTLLHFFERIRIYVAEQLDYKIRQIEF